MAVTYPRGRAIGALLLALLAVAGVILAGVLATVFFAITLAYVLYPLREGLVDRGIPPRVSSAVLTVSIVLVVIALFLPPLAVVYQRRTVILLFLQTLPDTVVIGVEGFSYAVESDVIVAGVRRELAALAVRLARDAAVIGLKLFLFVFVIYALVRRPSAVRDVSLEAVPAPYLDVVEAFHRRTRRTLYGIYVVQVATGVLTFLIALPVFFLFGYSAFFSLSVVAGILQFLPVVGPSLVILALAGFDFAVGNAVRGLLVLPIGLVAIGFVPDAVLRPQLANRTAGMAASLYFVGFSGGILSLGPVGIIAGPLAIALVLEAVELFVAELRATHVAGEGRGDEGGAA